MTNQPQIDITYEEARHVADLASLGLTEDRLEILHPQLSGVLSYMSKIQSLDTENIPETTQVTGLSNVFREDEIETSRMFTREEALSNAKRQLNGYFVVNGVLEG